MNSSATQTTTYTVADIRKVVDNFAADFSMMAQSTGLRTRESVAGVVSDLKVFAETGYLVRVSLMLKDKSGTVLRAAVYTVAESAVGWTSERPGNALWPRTPEGSLYVLATLSAPWWQMSEADQRAFVISHAMNGSWPADSGNSSLAGLTSTSGQKYASNGYGWERTNYG